jgi:hypothetical protein
MVIMRNMFHWFGKLEGSDTRITRGKLLGAVLTTRTNVMFSVSWKKVEGNPRYLELILTVARAGCKFAGSKNA